MDDDSGSYRLAVSPQLFDDGLTSDGKPRAIRYKKQILNEINQELQLEEHKLNVEEICEIYQTDPEFGLMFTQAKAILDRDGLNIIELDNQQSNFNRILFDHFLGGINCILWICSFLALVSYLFQNEYLNEISSNGLSLFIILILIIISITIMGYTEEKKTIELLNSFKKNSVDICTVIREGQKITINTTELAAGDLVEIKVGDRIPADLRLIRTNGLKIDSSEFTGESYPMSKNPEYSNENPLEAKNLCFYGTLCTEGMGLGVCIATGERTVISRLRNLAKSLTKREISTPLELSLFMQNCTIHSSILGLFALTMSLLMNFSWIDSFILFAGILFSIIPLSLLMVVTCAFNLTVRKVARRYCLVRDFKSIETLGNSNVLICDKTGTLTQNRLTVNHYWVDNEIYPADNTEDQVLNQQLLHLNSFLALSLASILCNSAEFESGQSEIPILKRKTTVNSNSIETALLKCMELGFGNVVEKRKLHTKVLEMPFNPLLKIHATIHLMNYDLLLADNPKYSSCYNIHRSRYLVVIKGAPEKVVERCTSAFINGREVPITDEFRLEFNKAYLHFGSSGERVIGFADLCLPKDKFPKNFKFDLDSLNFPLVGLRFLGLISMNDPPRSSVADSILKLRSAGVKVVIATGDHPTTAKAIARLTNIISENNETIEEAARRLALPIQQIDPSLAQVTIVHGTDLQQYTPDMLDSLTSSNQELIFARLTPQQKLQIVESFQRVGSIVACVGDGLNDIPMMKKSDASICLGANDNLKEHADLFILDNNFSTIVDCIVEGRWCKGNLKKIIAYLLSSNCPQFVAFISCFLFSLPLPFGIIGIFCIDLITNFIPAISLAYEDPEFGLQKNKDQSKESNIDNKNKNLMKYNNVFTAKTVNDGYLELLDYGPNDSRPIINNKLICYSYLQIGAIQAIAGLFAYFVIMAENGFWVSRLFYLREEWDSMAINDLKDSVGQEWSYEQRKELEYTCQTGYFWAIVICQWVTLIICKTRKNSIFKQRMNNRSLNFALILETLLALFLVYGPGMQNMIRFYPLCFSWLFIAFPFALIIFLYDEIRKKIIRKNENGWVQKETFY